MKSTVTNFIFLAVICLSSMTRADLATEYLAQESKGASQIPGCSSSKLKIQLCTNAIENFPTPAPSQIESAQLTNIDTRKRVNAICTQYASATVYFKMKETGQVIKRDAYIFDCSGE
jgi:hypothetical protein